MLIAVIILAVVVVGFIILTKPNPTHQRLEREATPEELEHIRILLRQGQEIEALKFYRHVTTKSLQEALAKIATLKD